jgi:hypothetical protein
VDISADMAPTCIPLTTTPEERLALTDALTAKGAEDPIVQLIARQIRLPARNTEEFMRNILRFVQDLRHVPNTTGRECLQGPVFTLSHGGDCKALAVLLVSLVIAGGYLAQTFWVDVPGKDLNHVTARVWTDGAWRWADPWVIGAEFGEDPGHAAGRLGGDHGLA